MKNVITWLRQPSSIAGLSTLLGTVSALLIHQITLAQAVPLLVGAAVSMALPDNTSAKADAVAMAADVFPSIKITGGTHHA